MDENDLKDIRRAHLDLINDIIDKMQSFENWQESEIRKLLDDLEREGERVFDRIEEIINES